MESNDPKDLGNGWVSWPCMDCGEVLLIKIGDEMSVQVGDNGEVVGIRCTVCAARLPGERKEP